MTTKSTINYHRSASKQSLRKKPVQRRKPCKTKTNRKNNLPSYWPSSRTKHSTAKLWLAKTASTSYLDKLSFSLSTSFSKEHQTRQLTQRCSNFKEKSLLAKMLRKINPKLPDATKRLNMAMSSQMIKTMSWPWRGLKFSLVFCKEAVNSETTNSLVSTGWSGFTKVESMES